MPATEPIIPDPRRLSLRLPRPLWIGVAAGALTVAAVGIQVGLPVWQQHVAICEVERAGARVETRPRSPAWLRGVIGDEKMQMFDRVQKVTFTGGRDILVTDVELEPLKELTSLESLSLIAKPVTDAGLEHMKGLTRLKFLWLGATQVSDAGLVHLAGLTSLE